MRKDIGTIIVGVLFLAAGILIGGSMLGFIDYRINLHGWWTLFIIVPALLAIAQGGVNVGNLIMLAVGVILLLDQQNILPGSFTWRLILPLILLGVGFQLLFGGTWLSGHHRQNGGNPGSGSGGASGSGTSGGNGGSGSTGYSGGAYAKADGGGIFTEKSKPGNSYKTASVIFGGQDIIYTDEPFTGGSYTALFGGLTINLRNVILSEDVVINTTAIFGGIDLIMPTNVQVVSNVVPILGGADNKFAGSRDANAHKIIVNGNAIFGAVEIK